MKIADPSFKSRVRGCLLGGALGDAIGADIEFLTWSQIQFEYGPDGLTDAPAGTLEFTDDTQMTLFTAEGFMRIVSRGLDRGAADVAAVMDHAYHRWLRTQGAQTPRWDTFIDEWPGWLIGEEILHQQRSPGNTCLALGDLEELYRLGQPPVNTSKGCGTVMRIAPIGFTDGGPYQGEMFDLARTSAALSHGHPTGQLSAAALALIISQLTDGVPLEMTFERVATRVRLEAGSDETLEAIEKARLLFRSGAEPSAHVVESLGGGWTAEEALSIAVYCSLVACAETSGADLFARGVLLAANHSGDSDSTAAITGNILGTILGEEGLPNDWLARLDGRELVSALADDLAKTIDAPSFYSFYAEEWMKRYPPN
jgi:ADP-ribosyl-[dinitrogen reductase] hydrolase